VEVAPEHPLELVVIGVHRSSSLVARVQLGCAFAQGGQRAAGLDFTVPDGDAEDLGVSASLSCS
jgi:hypothetical protein